MQDEKDRSHQPLYKQADQLRDIPRVDLPDDNPAVFEEVQPFDQTWLWAVMGIEVVVVFLPLLLTGQPWYILAVVAIIMALTLGMLSSIKLTTRIDSDGIFYRMTPFHFREQFIPWDEIDAVYVRKYSPVKEYGGWGMRYSRQGKAFNVKGNEGIQVVFKNGKKLMLGTQRGEEASQVLAKHPLTV